MDFHSALKHLRSHAEFSEEEEAYLAHGFLSDSADNQSQWQIGWYDPQTDMIRSYTVSLSAVIKSHPAQVFKESGSVEELNAENVLILHDEATKIAHAQLQKQYPQHPVMKTILLLQRLDGKEVYNITIVTKTLHMYNIRIDATSGLVLSSNIEPLMNLGQNV